MEVRADPVELHDESSLRSPVQVLRVVGAVVGEAVKRANKNQQRVMPRRIAFVPAGTVPKLSPVEKMTRYHSLLSAAQDWKCQVDLDRALQFPSEIALTRLSQMS